MGATAILTSRAVCPDRRSCRLGIGAMFDTYVLASDFNEPVDMTGPDGGFCPISPVACHGTPCLHQGVAMVQH